MVNIMNEKYMKEAIDLASANAKNDFKDGGPFGAVIVDRDGKIIGRGKNSVVKNHDATAHAEIMAIRDAGKNIESFNLDGTVIYTTSYPCPMCMAAILWSSIDKIYYANTKEDAANIGFRDDAIYVFVLMTISGSRRLNVLLPSNTASADADAVTLSTSRRTSNKETIFFMKSPPCLNRQNFD